MRRGVLLLAVLVALVAGATTIDVTVSGVARTRVAVQLPEGDFAKSLRRNLELSGLFEIARDGAVKVSGVPGQRVVAEGVGKVLSNTDPVSSPQTERMAARRLADQMCQAYGNQLGFACDRIAFIKRMNAKGRARSELCVCYPDGADIQQLTQDNFGMVGPRWAGPNCIFYNFLKDGPQVWAYDFTTGRRGLRWNFKGLTANAALSPDGRRVAIISSFLDNNAELYVLDGKRFTRLTNTPNASEGSPAWSPDGREIVYVSNESRKPQLYIIDVATRKSRRLTTVGRENVEPDWGADGRITYITRRGASQVAVMDPKLGESSARLVTPEGNWEHPSWSRDRRHVVASSNGALFIVDTLVEAEGGDAKPKSVFRADGVWTDPAWCR